MIELPDLVKDFAAAIAAADAKSPFAINVRTRVPFLPGIGPHSETRTVRLAIDEMQAAQPERYAKVTSMFHTRKSHARNAMWLWVRSRTGFSWRQSCSAF